MTMNNKKSSSSENHHHCDVVPRQRMTTAVFRNSVSSLTGSSGSGTETEDEDSATNERPSNSGKSKSSSPHHEYPYKMTLHHKTEKNGKLDAATKYHYVGLSSVSRYATIIILAMIIVTWFMPLSLYMEYDNDVNMNHHHPPMKRKQYLRLFQHPRRFHHEDHTMMLNSLRESTYVDSSSSSLQLEDQCRWYVAESSVPNSGLGYFTSRNLYRDDMISYPDICLYVSDPPIVKTHLFSHTWGSGHFFGQYEGRKSRTACEGMATIVNTGPYGMVNTKVISPVVPTHAGLHRAISPGAGAITHHYGIYGAAKDIIPSGTEILVDYYDWEFPSEDFEPDGKYSKKPSRDLVWLQQYGWCVDNIRIDISTIPHAGRGAFARVPISKGSVVGPAPLQMYKDRKLFQTTNPEQLFVNYCLQPAESNMIMFPYGQGVNLINHSYKQPNVEWRWSTHMNQMHHAEWLDLPMTEFWDVVKPGSLILEVVALRDIKADEEILINYGSSWEDAWQKHISKWQPIVNATEYVYPMDMDESGIVRTVEEQKTEPYPKNIMTVCYTKEDVEREVGELIEWKEPREYYWWEGMTYCHVLDRLYQPRSGNYVYTVSLIYTYKPEGLMYNPNTSRSELYIDYNVPRHAIRFVEMPYMDDEHLINAFRHPMELPKHLVPEAWKRNRTITTMTM